MDMSEAERLRHKLRQDGNLVLDVKVIPRSRSGRVQEVMESGRLKITVRAAPEAGKANDEACALLAEYLEVPRRNVDVILGHTSQLKRIKVVR